MIIGNCEVSEDFDLKRRIRNGVSCGSDSLVT
jgi:hypothetical protein